MRLKALLCFSFLLCSACAGPTTPFGAVDVWHGRALSYLDKVKSRFFEQAPRVYFSPQRQKLHGSSPFNVIIEDPAGVPEDFTLKISYNGLDVSSQFLSRAETTHMDPLNRRLKLSTKHMRLLATRDNKIEVVYIRKEGSDPVVAEYLPPSCSAFENSRSLASVPEFNPPERVIETINQQALRFKLNPHYVAGLIAQESAFDPTAVSKSKAIGLTQVTSLGEGEIVKRYGHWPRYPGLGNMPAPMIRWAVLNGEVHERNEWRLNPELSIQGGVAYLGYLTEYWNRPEKRAQVYRHLGGSDVSFSEVMLASYNSGASRVSEALERKGADWLKDDELNEARNYVRKVVSYCDHFSHGEE